MTELAHRLNELALANSNGFLDNDEYRLLRRNAFEEYSVNVAVPSETPVVPIAAPPELPETPKPHNRPKLTIPLGVTSLLSKASGRRTPKHTRDPTSSTPIPREGRSISKPSTPGPESPSGNLKLSAMIPKLLQRRPTYRRTTEIPRPLTDALNASRTIRASNFPLQSPISPQSSKFPVHVATNQSNLSLHPHVPQDSRPTSPVNHKETDIFSDDNLSTSTDVRIAISKTEDELRNLIDAFLALETRTHRQILKQNAHRLTTTTPASVDILFEGKEWREHRRIPSIPRYAPLLDTSHGYLFASATRESFASDGTSLHSASSNRTNLSQPRSTASLQRVGSPSRSTPGPLTPGSPLQFPALLHANGKRILAAPRKNSVSSTTTSVSSFKSGIIKRNESLHPPSPSASAAGSLRLSSMLSRSRSHLGLKNLKGSSWMFSEETLLSVSSSSRDETGASGSPSHAQGTSETEIENDPALIDVRRRKEKLIARYNSRLEFLRAKLKSAELHERLLRK